MVATDGQRMAVTSMKSGFDNILVPLDFVSLVLKLKEPENKNTFWAGCSGNIILLKSECLTLFTRLIDEEFPDYSQAIPRDSTRAVRIERKSLMQALKRIMLMGGKDYQMRVEFHPSSLILSSCTPQLGNASEEMEVEYRSEEKDDKPFSLGLNGKFLVDMLEVLEGERVTLQMRGNDSPLMIEEHESLHILMPLYVSDAPDLEPETQSETECEVDPKSEPEPEFVEEVESD